MDERAILAPNTRVKKKKREMKAHFVLKPAVPYVKCTLWGFGYWSEAAEICCTGKCMSAALVDVDAMVVAVDVGGQTGLSDEMIKEAETVLCFQQTDRDAK